MKTSNPVYDFFRPELRDASYKIGDVYSPDVVQKAQQDWDILSNTTGKEYPYLSHVKALSNTWPHLRLLADFMEVTTTPVRWEKLSKNNAAGFNKEREERASRTNVTVLKYMASGDLLDTSCRTESALLDALKEETAPVPAIDECKLRLYVVEDLSRDVIEALGSTLDIEPAFFREHIVDFAWCNIRDRWQDPPRLMATAQKQRWVQLRYVTARYFKTSDEFTKGVKEAEQFNVMRRPDDDVNNKAVWDDKIAIVGITRTRASFWLRKGEEGKPAVGVLLLDPTMKEGTPLWYGYRNWEPTPGINTPNISAGPPRDSLFNDFIYWAKKMSPPPANTTTQTASTTSTTSNTHVPIQALLYLICAEWLTIADYIRTRIGQIEWEVSIPDHFLNKGVGIDDALKKLHIWRRLVPLYREMLSDSRQQVFHFPCHDHSVPSLLPATPATSTACACSIHAHPPSSSTTHDPILAISTDFTRVLSQMVEYQSRIDRLTSVVTAIISIEDSRRGQDDNRNVARVTWLATVFIPLSYIASLFSMQADLGTLGHTMGIYFATAVPVAACSLGLAWVLTLPWVLGVLRGWKVRGVGVVGGKKG